MNALWKHYAFTRTLPVYYTFTSIHYECIMFLKGNHERIDLWRLPRVCAILRLYYECVMGKRNTSKSTDKENWTMPGLLRTNFTKYTDQSDLIYAFRKL